VFDDLESGAKVEMKKAIIESDKLKGKKTKKIII
jgi:hypothetical protein